MGKQLEDRRRSGGERKDDGGGRGGANDEKEDGKKSEIEPASVLSETKRWRGELCYFSEELVLRPLAPHHCSRPNCSLTGEKKASPGPKGEKKKPHQKPKN